MNHASRRIRAAIARAGTNVRLLCAGGKWREVCAYIQPMSLQDETAGVLGIGANKRYTAYFAGEAYTPVAGDTIRHGGQSFAIMQVQPCFLAGKVVYYRALLLEEGGSV